MTIEPIKKAILIADSYDSPYCEIRRDIHPIIWNSEYWHDYDVYYMKGKRLGRCRNFIYGINEKLRSSRFWLFVRINDTIWLNCLRKKTPLVKLENQDIFVDIPEGLRYLGLKLKFSLKYLANKDYDVIIKTTSSSIFNKNILDSFLTSYYEKDSLFYGGSIINKGDYQFASGANLILSRKSIDLIVNKNSYWDQSVLDDVAIGKIMKKAGVTITEFETLNIASLEYLKNLEKTIFNSIGHYRCRNFEKPRKDSIILMNIAKEIGLIS